MSLVEFVVADDQGSEPDHPTHESWAMMAALRCAARQSRQQTQRAIHEPGGASTDRSGIAWARHIQAKGCMKVFRALR